MHPFSHSFPQAGNVKQKQFKADVENIQNMGDMEKVKKGEELLFVNNFNRRVVT